MGLSSLRLHTAGQVAQSNYEQHTLPALMCLGEHQGQSCATRQYCHFANIPKT